MEKKLWTDESKKWVSKAGTHWAKLRIKNDAKANEQYIDVLIGEKDKPSHMHMGINLDQSTRFQKPRGVVRSITREVQSAKRGLIEDNMVMVDPTVSPVKTFVLKINIVVDTREVTIEKFREEPSSD